MATITVTNLLDSGSGSLRQAILDANAGDTINFSPVLAGGTLVLTSGELDITKNLTIDGDIAGSGTPGITIDAQGQSRVFDETGAPAIFATLDGLIISNGSAAFGGGIATGDADNLFLNNSQVINNQASSSGGGIYGGPGGEVVLTNTSVSGNTSGGIGGGIYANSLLSTVNTTISGNSSTNKGGGIGLGYAGLGTFTNTTLTGNKTGDKGGAIYGHGASQIRFYDSTVTGNYAGAVGGGIYNGGSTFPLTLISNSIVAGNAALVSSPDLGLDSSPLFIHGNNILGSAPANASQINTLSGTYTQIDGSNQAALETVFAVVGNNPDTGALSGALADNGGSVNTVAINPAGIAYNAGSNAALPTNLSDDARGYARVVGGTVDIGAFEQQSLVVTTLADNPYDGGTLAQELAEGNGLSLRQALGLANANPGPHTVTFAPNLAGGTIHLTNGELDVTNGVTIDGDITGNGTPGITIDAGGASRVFDVDNGVSVISATLDGLVIRGGDSGSVGSGDSGGGIAVGQSDTLTLKISTVADNQGYAGGGIYGAQNSTVTLINASVFSNSSDQLGGGIYADGTLTLTNATISGNSSQSTGGGIGLGSNTTATLTNATIAGNSSGGSGGGISGDAFTIIRLYNSTLTGNYAIGQGGGIYTAGGGSSLTLANSIVAGDAASLSGNDVDLNGEPLVLEGNNILGSTPANASPIDRPNGGTYTQIDGTSQAALATVFAQVGQNSHTGVLSGLLADNGGPVRTVAINPAGVAYNAGSNTALPPNTFNLDNSGNTTEPLPVDARGFARVSGGTVDVGAFEQQPGANFVVTTLADNPYDGGTLAQELAEGQGLSLRQALGLANQDPTSADTITFAPDLVGGSMHGVNDGVLLLTNGALTINGNVTIDGNVTPAGNQITIDGQGASQDFVITGGRVALEGLTITGGYAAVDGGGVSLETGSYAPANVFLTDSTITNNQAAYGGGVSLDGGDTLVLTDSTISRNSANYVGGGIASKGALEIFDSTVSGNSAGYLGGGIASRGTLALVNSTLSGNQITNSSHGATYGSAGAGLYNAGGAALVNTTISGNNGGYAGGGIYNSGGLLLTNATIANNSAYNGGGLYNAACGCGNAALYDSTFTGNYAKQFGGGIHNANGTVTLTNTIAAGNGTGYHGSDIETGSATTNYYGVNLFSQAGVGRPGIDIVQPDLTQVFLDLTTIDPDGVPNSGDEFAAGTLANNGGLVQTVAIKLGGSAQNTGSTADLPPDLFDLNNNGDTTEPLPVDARGEPRVSGSAVDIGAFEAQAPPAPYDFNADGKSDLLFQNTDATPQIWLMNGTSVISETSLPDPPVQWKIVGSGDFNGDGDADILWLNTINNAPAIWIMNGTTMVNGATLPAPPPSWRIAGIGDFYGTGDADILWQNTNGAVTIWEMNGTSIVNNTPLTTPPAGLKVVATGDFNGDGHADILFINTLTNAPTIWEMNGTSIIGQATLAAPPPQWEIVGTGDFNGDGDADILWLNTVSNQASIWEMNGTSVISAVALPAPPPVWKLIGTSDVNGDGKSDLLWQNTVDGTVTAWEMNGTSIAANVPVGSPGAGWQLNNNDPPLPTVALGTSGTANGNGGTMHMSMPDTVAGNAVPGPPTTSYAGGTLAASGGGPMWGGLDGFGSSPGSLLWQDPMPGVGGIGVPSQPPVVGGTSVANSMYVRSG
jgi:predicted outer membrane repeat protein